MTIQEQASEVQGGANLGNLQAGNALTFLSEPSTTGTLTVVGSVPPAEPPLFDAESAAIGIIIIAAVLLLVITWNRSKA